MALDRRGEKRVTVYRAQLPDTGELREVEYEAVADALHFACRDLREGRRRPVEIVENGVTVYDEAGIRAACEAHDREQAVRHPVLDDSGDGAG